MSNDKPTTLLSDPSQGASAKATSILQKNSKLYGPMHALDLENPSSCWNSDGCPDGKKVSSFMLDFGRIVQPSKLMIQFQAGFVGEELQVFYQDETNWKPLIEIEADDDHDLQEFDLFDEQSPDTPSTSALKISFRECTDFYGRVTIYQLQVWGHEVTVNGESD